MNDRSILQPEDYVEPACVLCGDPYGAEPEVYDVIGRRRDVRVEGGKLRLDLDGEPMFVYGLDLAETFPATGTRQATHETISERDIDYAAEEKSGSLND